MTADRYVRGVLTVIAGALVYLGVVLSPWPGVSAQGQPRLVKPGEIVGPMEVVVVGWSTPAGVVVPVAVTGPVATTVQNTVQVRGTVATERSTGAADRVVLVGWEERSGPRSGTGFRAFDATTPQVGLPTTVVPR